MSRSVDRRSFLTGSLALLGSSALLGCDDGLLDPALRPAGPRRALGGPGEAVTVHPSHSGSLPGPGYAVLGAIVTTDPGTHDAALEALRPVGFRRRLRYSSNDWTKLPYGRAVIDYFLDQDPAGLRFHAGVVGPGRRGRHDLLSGYDRLAREATAAGSAITLELEPTTSIGLDPELRDHFAALPGVTVRPAGSPSPLLQLADLLTGSVYGDATLTPARRGAAGPRAQDGVKAALIHHLRDRLGVHRLTDEPVEHPHFAVSFWSQRGNAERAR